VGAIFLTSWIESDRRELIAVETISESRPVLGFFLLAFGRFRLASFANASI
jgi:hypothetical protein